MPVEVITAVVVFALVVVTTVAALVGVGGMLGLIRLARCPQCGHLTVSAAAAPPAACPHCRHEWRTHALPHPLRSLHNAVTLHRIGHGPSGPRS